MTTVTYAEHVAGLEHVMFALKSNWSSAVSPIL